MLCSINECTKEAKCKGLCWMHYKRQQLETNRESYNKYQKEYQAKIRDKVNEYHKTEKYILSHRKSQSKYYFKKEKKNE